MLEFGASISVHFHSDDHIFPYALTAFVSLGDCHGMGGTYLREFNVNFGLTPPPHFFFGFFSSSAANIQTISNQTSKEFLVGFGVMCIQG